MFNKGKNPNFFTFVGITKRKNLYRCCVFRKMQARCKYTSATQKSTKDNIITNVKAFFVTNNALQRLVR